jgi:hypothetical protein
MDNMEGEFSKMTSDFGLIVRKVTIPSFDTFYFEDSDDGNKFKDCRVK